MRYDLECRYDARQSFYGKAKVEEKEYDNFIAYVLYSYGTEVASVEIDVNRGFKNYYYNGKYSQTTTRHQKEFFRQWGLSDSQIKDLFNRGILTVYD